MITNKGSKIKCRRCGGEYFSDDMKLDGVYGMVVCPDCVKGRKAREQVERKRVEEKQKEAAAPPQPPKPAGWDMEDDLLNKMAKDKERSKTVSEVELGKVKCRKCSYVFRYDEHLNKPSNCPYCGINVKR